MAPVVHDPEFFAFAALGLKKPRIADVGANRGQSIVSFKNMFPDCTIDSYEANPVHYAALESLAATFPDRSVRIHTYGLGDIAGTARFHIPVIDGVEYLEEVSMNPQSFEAPWVKERFAMRGSDLRFRKFDAPIRIGDEENLAPDILKIDVEGAELSVIKGFRRTIETCRPVIFSENSDDDVTLHLLDLGYTEWMSDPDTPAHIRPFEGTRVNTYHLAQEKLPLYGLAAA